MKLRYILPIAALAVFVYAGAVMTGVIASADTTVVVSNASRSCDQLDVGNGTITGAPVGATLQFVAPNSTTYNAVINGSSYTVTLTPGPPGGWPTTAFPLNWVVKSSGGDTLGSGTASFLACTTPVTTPTTTAAPPVITTPTTTAAPPVTTTPPPTAPAPKAPAVGVARTN